MFQILILVRPMMLHGSKKAVAPCIGDKGQVYVVPSEL